MKRIWYNLFLVERPSIVLSFFRIFVAITVGAHVLPTLCHLADNYFLDTAFVESNVNFFTPEIVEFIQKNPNSVVVAVVIVFCTSWLFFLLGVFSQLSCIVMTACCYYFYARNSLHVGTLSWDILLVTLFLMCITAYHGDYFSIDSLWRRNENAYKRTRPYFIQRLLQMQIAFTYFYTALYKITAQGNWLKENPIYYLMNYPTQGVVKGFILKDWLQNKPDLCYALGILIVVIELLMPVFLWWRKTRLSAVYLGFLFHIVLILTLDVPAIFFFLFPAQLLLFINPHKVVEWIEEKRAFNQTAQRPRILYDGHCGFCLESLKTLKVMDVFQSFNYINIHDIENFQALHPQLTKDKALSQMQMITSKGHLHEGFEIYRRISFQLPMLYPFIPLLFFPGMSVIGNIAYRFVANNRYLFHRAENCQNNACFRKTPQK